MLAKVLLLLMMMKVSMMLSVLQDISPERAFADYCICNVVLHLVVITFLG